MWTAMTSVVSCRWSFKISAEWEVNIKHRHQTYNLVSYNKNTRFHYIKTLILITLIMIVDTVLVIHQKAQSKVVDFAVGL